MTHDYVYPCYARHGQLTLTLRTALLIPQRNTRLDSRAGKWQRYRRVYDETSFSS
jgi:hypothetical protein